MQRSCLLHRYCWNIIQVQYDGTERVSPRFWAPFYLPRIVESGPLARTPVLPTTKHGKRVSTELRRFRIRQHTPHSFNSKGSLLSASFTATSAVHERLLVEATGPRSSLHLSFLFLPQNPSNSCSGWKILWSTDKNGTSLILPYVLFVAKLHDLQIHKGPKICLIS